MFKRVIMNRDLHGFGDPCGLTGMGTHGYGYGSQLGYPWTRAQPATIGAAGCCCIFTSHITTLIVGHGHTFTS
ncbi:hypothetical protein L208DRAFT_921551 [Tricholoma matsutake]|nr:hypothetical protein L208DRAFT_921551 [Tricholoma matsutake 945]